MAWPVSNNFLNALSSPSKKWAWKLHVDWTSNATEPRPTVSASSSYDETYLAPDNLTIAGPESRPYVVLDFGATANGNWYALPEPDIWVPWPGNAGWWSAEKSDSSGQFTTPPYVEITYPPGSLRKTNVVRVVSTRYYSPVDTVRIKYKPGGASDWNTLGTFPFNTSHYVEAPLPETTFLAALRVEVLTTAQAEDYARLTEVDAIWREEYTGADLSRLDITRRLEFLVASGPPIGTIAASEMSADLVGVEGVSPRVGIRMLPWWGIYTASGWEWVPQGIYFLDEWDWQAARISLRGRDLIGLLQQRTFRPRLLLQSKILTAAEYLLHHAGVNDNDVIANGISTATWDYLILTGDNPASALQDLVGSMLHHLWVGMDGRVWIRSRTSSGSPVAAFSDSTILSTPRVTRRAGANIVKIRWTDISRGPCQQVGVISEDDLPGGVVERQGEFSKAPVISLSGIVVPDGEVLEWIGNDWEYLVILDCQGEEAVRFLGQPAIQNEKVEEARDNDLVRVEGPHELELDIPATGAESIRGLADDVLEYLAAGKEAVALDVPPHPHLEAGDLVSISSNRNNLSGTYLITSLSLGAGDMMHLEVLEK